MNKKPEKSEKLPRKVNILWNTFLDIKFQQTLLESGFEY